MSDAESRKAFEAWVKAQTGVPLDRINLMYLCWSARDAEVSALKARVEAARNAMIAYANENPKHSYNGVEQDPNGVHAWLAANVKLPGG